MVAHVLAIDRFGNAALNLAHEDLAGTGIPLGRPGGAAGARGALPRALRADVRRRRAAATSLVYEDSYRTLAIAINRGDAAATLRLAPDGEVRITPR